MIKKIILTGIVGVLTICGYTSAGSITITSNGSTTSSYTPSSYKLPEGVNTSDITISNAVCNGYGNDTYLYITNGKTDEYEMEYCDIVCDGYNNLQNGCSDTYILEGETIYFKSYYDVWGDNDDIYPIASITLDIPEGESGGGNIGGGSDGGAEGGNIITEGTEAFSGIITKLGNIFGEFGPYIIYIALACLGVSLLFKALKRLLGFTNNKAKNSIGGREGMKERRNRRRRNRRFQRYIYRNERRNGGETYGQYYKRKRVNNKPKFGSRGYNSRRN